MAKQKFKFFLAALILGALGLSAAGELSAQGNSLAPAVVIVIDSAAIQQRSLVGKDITSQIDVLQKRIQTEVDAENNALREEAENLQAQFASMTPEQLVPRQRQYDAKVQAFRRKVEEKQKNIQRTLSLATNEIERAMRPILREIMDQRSANFVFDKAQVALALPSIEVTDLVIEMLDKKLPAHVLDIAGLE